MSFNYDLNIIKELIEKTDKQYDVVKETKDSNDIIKLIVLSENLTNTIRLIPYNIGIKNAEAIVSSSIDIFSKENDYKIELSDNGFYLKIPCLLPKKENNPIYIRGLVSLLMKSYFEKREYDFFKEHMYIVYIQNYSNYNNIKDHSNIEFNSVEDIIASYLLIDDSPKFLSHIYLSKFNAKKDFSEIHLIKASNIIDFLAKNGEII